MSTNNTSAQVINININTASDKGHDSALVHDVELAADQALTAMAEKGRWAYVNGKPIIFSNMSATRLELISSINEAIATQAGLETAEIDLRLMGTLRGGLNS